MSLKDLLNTPIGGKADDKPGKGKSGKKTGGKADKKSGGKSDKKKSGKSGEKKGIKLGRKGRKPSTRNLPVKRSINLAAVGEKPIQVKLAVPAIVLIVVAAILLSKFFVVDRLLDMYRAQNEVSSLQSQLDDAYRQLNSFGDMTDEYAHYTYSGMTAEELARTDRGAVMDLLQRMVLPQAAMSSWSLTGNILTLNISRASLQDINLLAQELNEDPLVNFCTVTTASTNTSQQEGIPNDVVGQVMVYLNSKPEEVEAQ